MNAVAPASSPPPRRRWPRRLLLAILLLIGLPAGYYFYASWALKSDIARALDETDALDPRWRLDDLEADSKTYPDADNSALQIVNVGRLMGRGQPSAHKDYGPIFDHLPPAAQLNPQQIALLRECFDSIPEALVEARKLKDMPHGRFAARRDPSGLWVMFPDHHHARPVCDLLEHEAMLKVQFGDPDAALEACRAQFNVARAMADDFSIISYFIRVGCDTSLVTTLERVLAQSDKCHDTPLKHMQSLLHEEHEQIGPQWITALRGERAESHRFYEPMITGKKRWLQMAETMRIRVGWEDQLNHYLPMRLIKDFPQHLRLRNEIIEAARLPLHEQLERFAELEQKLNCGDARKTGLAQFLPLLPLEMPKVGARHLRSQALLRAAEAALACERYRLERRSWPDSLDALVKAGLLDLVPADPFDGQPLRLAKHKEGVTVYSVGEDKCDNGGQIDRDRPREPGADVGFRMWDPLNRRQPPRPPVDVP